MITTNARRIGQFDVSLVYFLDLENKMDNGLEMLFERMIVLRAEQQWNAPAVKYLAIHPAFRPIKECDVPPTYQAIYFAGSAQPFWIEQPGNGRVVPPPTMRCPPSPHGGRLQPWWSGWCYTSTAGKEWMWTEARGWQDPAMPMFQVLPPAWGWREAWREIRGWFGGQD